MRSGRRPVVFRTALVAWLPREYALDQVPDDPHDVSDYFKRLTYCDAIARAVGLKPAKMRTR